MANALIEFSNELANSVEHGGRSVVAVKEGGRIGVSGTVWRNEVVVTADHTIRGREEVTVILPSGQEATATVVGRDPSTDVAVLKVPGTGTMLPEFGDPAQLRVGNFVLALGRGVQNGLKASSGVVSAVGGAWRTWQGGRIDQWLRLDLNPYPGFSGGPLVDAGGLLLGMNTSGPRRTVLTIPKTTLERIVEQLLSKGRIVRGYIGIGGQPVTIPPAIQEKLELPAAHGLLVVTIADEGPAERAGLMVGDIILSISGSLVAEPGDLLAALEPDTVGKTLGLRVLRGGAATDLNVTIGEREGD